MMTSHSDEYDHKIKLAVQHAKRLKSLDESLTYRPTYTEQCLIIMLEEYQRLIWEMEKCLKDR